MIVCSINLASLGSARAFDALHELLILCAGFLERPNAVIVLFFIADVLIVGDHCLSVFLHGSLQLSDTLITLITNDTGNILQVVEKYFPLLLFLRVLVELVDFAHVIQLLVEVLLRVDESVEEVAVFSVLLRLVVEGVIQLE